ncbi:MAG: NUDIX domain-containing protein [Nocardioides sp.]|nr:NUDIX domain-containing protein [Nocardioides sp.]
MPDPMRRTTARVVPVNRDGEVLLLFGRDPKRPDLPFWFTIGGATEPGETLAEAGSREMLEETGIAVRPDDLVGPYHRGVHEFCWNGWDIANDSHFFAVRLDDVTVSFDGLEPLEVGNVLDSGWWSPRRMPQELASPDLPEVARLAVAAVGL